MKIGIARRFADSESKDGTLAYLCGDPLLRLVLDATVQATGGQTGTGTLADPYKPSTLGQWYDLATNWKTRGQRTEFHQVGGRLIARWGKHHGFLSNYCTDVTGMEAELAKVAADEKAEAAFSDATAKAYMKADDERIEREHKVTKQSPYTRIATRFDGLDDCVLATASRLVLQGSQDSGAVPAPLPNALCGLLLCETQRCSSTFIISLMLLDLIETRTTYGKDDHQKLYTWKSMLMHDNDPRLQVPGRGDGKQKLGKHPMTGQGTVGLTKDKGALFSPKDNMSRDRIVSITSVWMAHYLARRAPSGTEPFFLVKSSTKAWTDNQAGKQPKQSDLPKAVRDALAVRAASVNCLIGGTRVLYVDLKGNRV